MFLAFNMTVLRLFAKAKKSPINIGLSGKGVNPSLARAANLERGIGNF